MGWTRACGSAFAQRGQDHADVGRRHHQRVPSPALARDRWQAGLPRLRLHHLLRLPAVGGPAALTLQGLSEQLLDPLGHAVRAPQAAAADLSARRRRLAVRSGWRRTIWASPLGVEGLLKNPAPRRRLWQTNAPGDGSR